ncbi:MAG: DUF504 domain-containing protein [Thermoplasmata archaeon]|nr:MAG: DUF504 domain-containing protein [Thermoplasmata archaeon]
MKIKELINKLKWHPGYDFDRVRIWYISRGKQGNIDYIDGNDIKSIGEIFIETSKASIPYHRILRIEYNGKTIFERQEK